MAGLLVVAVMAPVDTSYGAHHAPQDLSALVVQLTAWTKQLSQLQDPLGTVEPVSMLSIDTQ